MLVSVQRGFLPKIELLSLWRSDASGKVPMYAGILKCTHVYSSVQSDRNNVPKLSVSSSQVKALPQLLAYLAYSPLQ